ncbi:hypothetical protein Tco_0865687 [Tanacetum coccineum]
MLLFIGIDPDAGVVQHIDSQQASLEQVIGSPYTGNKSNLTASSAMAVTPMTSTVAGTSNTVMNATGVKIPVLLETICVLRLGVNNMMMKAICDEQRLTSSSRSSGPQYHKCLRTTRILKKKKLKINVHKPVGTRVVSDEEGNTLLQLATLADTSATDPALLNKDKFNTDTQQPRLVLEPQTENRLLPRHQLQYLLLSLAHILTMLRVPLAIFPSSKPQ